jgi:hypothetical protein
MGRNKDEIDLSEGWPEEEALRKQLTGRFRRLFKARGLEKTPMLALRLRDVLTAFFVVQRLERKMQTARCEGSEDEKSELSVMEAHGKASERWRKAMKELEEYCAATGRPVGTGLADLMKPIILKVDRAFQEEAEKLKEKTG